MDKTESSVQVTDKSVTTEDIVKTERVDTTIMISADSSTFITALQDIIDSPGVVFEDDDQRIEMQLDQITKKLLTKAIRKAKSVPVLKEVTTVTKREVKSDVKIDVDQSSKVTEKTRAGLPAYVWIIGLILIVCGTILFFWFRKRNTIL